MSPVQIEHITVKRDRLCIDVVVPNQNDRYTDTVIADRALRLRPHLKDHACVNDEGPTFGSVIGCTSIPHLLEHLVIDLQTERSKDERDVFTGITYWTNEPLGCAHIEVSIHSDIMGLTALRDAMGLLDTIAAAR